MRALGPIALAAALALPAHADEADTLLIKIQSDLRDLTRDIGALGRSSADQGDVEGVAGDVIDMVDDLLRLIRVMGDNHQAEQTIKGYPASMDELIDSLEVLAQMKGMTGEFQPGQELCAELLEAVPGEMSALLIAEGTTVRSLDRIGDSYARQAQSLMRDADRHLGDLDDMARGVKGYRPDHRDFNAHAAALSDAADATYKAEAEAFEAMAATCERVIDYKKQPYYEDAETLLKDRENAIGEFLNNGRAWLDENRDIGGQICESHRLLRQAYCDLDLEPENLSRRSAYDRAIEDSARAFRSKVADALSNYDRNLEATAELYSPLSREVRDLVRGLDARRDYLTRLRDGAPLKGMNNPSTRLWRDYGVQQHLRLQRSLNCSVAERRIPGMSGTNTPDCISLQACQVIEIKPGSTNGLKDGGKIEEYVFAINDWLEEQWPDHEGTPIPSKTNNRNMRFDDQFVEQARAWGCLTESGRATFWGDVETYRPCSETIDLACEP